MPQFRPSALGLHKANRSGFPRTSSHVLKLHDEAASRVQDGPATIKSEPAPSHADSKKPSMRAGDGDWRRLLQLKRKGWQREADKRLAELGARINELSGYREVERLKIQVQANEDRLNRRRETVAIAKEAYASAVAARDTAQREVNSLLERKHSWRDEDVAKFTSLVRADHASHLAVANTSDNLRTAETAADKAFSELMQSILQRYHEEQIWSDKIRSASTWANQIGLLVNLFVFIGAIAFVEPWKRRKLVEKLEQRMCDLMDRTDDKLSVLSSSIQAQVAQTPLQFESQLPNKERRAPKADEIDDDSTDGKDLRHFVWAAAWPRLPSWASDYEQPSHKRDLVVVGGGSLALGVVLTHLFRLVLGS